jgi:hypothetical protein
MTFAELLHDIIKYGDFKGGIDLEEAHKAIDSEYQTPETGPAPEVGIDASASGVSGRARRRRRYRSRWSLRRRRRPRCEHRAGS